jgi:hypothetical protein
LIVTVYLVHLAYVFLLTSKSPEKARIIKILKTHIEKALEELGESYDMTIPLF